MKFSLKTILSIVVMLLSAVTVVAEEKQPAFPGAEGYARYITGGRGGAVYYVTSLEDDGSEGTLRWAINKTGARTILFKVSGTIFLKSSLNITNGDVTIAGQSAPGDGICVADYPVAIKANNVIVRYMRFRLGNQNVTLDGADGWDGFGGFDQENIMIDHCSVSWSIDECLSVLGNKNTTVQWCIVSHPLVNSGHSKGAHGYGGNWGGNHASFHHNLLAHCGSRSPRLGPRPTTQLEEHMDMRNNVMYNWAGEGCYGGEGMDVNIVNNYYKPGPGTASRSTAIQMRIAAVGCRTTEYITTYPTYADAWHKWGHYYVDGNVNTKYSSVTNDNWTYGFYNQIDASGNDGTYTSVTKDTIKLDSPISFIYTTTHSAADAYDRVLSYAGCSKSRDAYDADIVKDATNGTASYTGEDLAAGYINTQNDLPLYSETNGAWPDLVSKSASVDTDGDGMPDNYEDTNGLDYSDASDGAKVASNGYTNLENYLNSLVNSITTAQNVGGEALGDTEEVDHGDANSYDTVGTGTITYTVVKNTSIENVTPTVSADLKNYITAAKATIGSNLSTSANRWDTYTTGPDGSQTLQRITATVESTDETGINDIVFSVTPSDGYLFMPSGASFYVNKGGTDGGNAKAIISNDNFSSEIYNASPSRNSVDAEKGYNYYSYVNETLSAPYASSNVTSLTLRLTAFATNKNMGVGTVIIKGSIVKPTGIRNVNASNAVSANAPLYNISGQRVSSSYSGVVISNGKKFVK